MKIPSTLNEYEKNDIDAQLSYENVTEIISDLHKEYNKDDGDYEEYWDKMHDMVLSVEEKKKYEICLGTGGPGYHLNVEVSGSGNQAYIEKMSYTYLNWFYRKEIPIDKGSDDWDTWSEFAANFVEEWL